MQEGIQLYFKSFFGVDRWLAREKKELARLGITHIVNTAQGEKYFMVHTNEAYYADTGITSLDLRPF